MWVIVLSVCLSLLSSFSVSLLLSVSIPLPLSFLLSLLLLLLLSLSHSLLFFLSPCRVCVCNVYGRPTLPWLMVIRCPSSLFCSKKFAEINTLLLPWQLASLPTKACSSMAISRRWYWLYLKHKHAPFPYFPCLQKLSGFKRLFPHHVRLQRGIHLAWSACEILSKVCH